MARIRPALPNLGTLMRRATRIARKNAKAWSSLAAAAVPPPKKLRAKAATPAPVPVPNLRDQFSTGRFLYRRTEHTYKLYLPPLPKGQAAPSLVVMLHGCGQGPDDFAAGTQMNAAARAHNTAVLYPAQRAAANRHRCWNWFRPEHQQRGRGEPAWIAALTRAVVRALGVPPRHTYVAGLSAGGAMAATVAHLYPELFTACGIHSGLAPGAAHGALGALSSMRTGARLPPAAAGRHVPTIVFHGDRDKTVHPRHGEHLVNTALDSTRRGLPARADSGLITRHGLSASGPYTQHIYVDAKGQVLAERWQLHALGHGWSGGSRRGSYVEPAGPDASAEMLRFFAQCSAAPTR